jgi:hypothetical protein
LPLVGSLPLQQLVQPSPGDVDSPGIQRGECLSDAVCYIATR